MADRLYEVRFYKQGREVKHSSPALATFDLSDAESMRLAAKRHIEAAAERDSSRRSEAHLYHLEARAVDPATHKGAGDVLFRLVLPVGSTDPDDWRWK